MSAAVTPETTWERVGGNASLTAWANTTVDDYFLYPLDVALANYHTGNSIRRATLLHLVKLRSLLTWMAGFICITAVKPLKRVSKRAKMSFRCITSKFALDKRFFYKSTWLVLPPTLFGLPPIGWHQGQNRQRFQPDLSNRWFKSVRTLRLGYAVKVMFGC
ncbi:MAG: hypothetical protein M5U34_21065 [Chloroflexi bacterium]|nr:hypothetical protein [Chloroflexota bacterium]